MYLLMGLEEGFDENLQTAQSADLSLSLCSYCLFSNKYLPPQGFGPEAKTRGGIPVSPAYTCKECAKYNKNIGVVCESISI